MKIMQMIDSLAVGGSEKMAVLIANEFSASSIENCLVVTRNDGPLRTQLNRATSLNLLHKRGALDFAAIIRLIDITRKFKPDYIHAHSSSIFWAVLLKLFFPKVRVIWHDHYGLSEQLQSGDRRAYKLISPLIDGIICVNETLKKWNEKEMRVKHAQIIQLNNFSVLSREFQNEVKAYDVVCLANFRRQKNQLMLIEAIGKLAAKGHSIRCAFVGKIGDPQWFDKCVNRIRQLKLADHIFLHHDLNDPAEILSTSRIGVLCSDSEGLPLSIIEYGLSRLPVISTEVGQCAALLNNGECGYLVHSNDSDQLASQIEWALSHPDDAASMAKKLQLRMEASFSWQTFRNGYFNLLEKIEHQAG